LLKRGIQQTLPARLAEREVDTGSRLRRLPDKRPEYGAYPAQTGDSTQSSSKFNGIESAAAQRSSISCEIERLAHFGEVLNPYSEAADR
jgi:hypothetical protein